jgi:hypothetical protein
MVTDTSDILSKLNIDGSISAKDFVHILLFENDASDIDEIRRKFKKNFLDKFKDILENTTKKDIKKIFDPLNLTSLLRDSEEIREDFKKYKRKLKNFLKKANEELSTSKKQQEESIDDSESTGNNNKPPIPELNYTESQNDHIGEQQEFGPKAIIVELGEKTNKFFIDLFENFKGDKLNQTKPTPDQNQQQSSGGNSLLDFLGYAIAGGLLATFWHSHIRPFLEEQFDFMDRLKGTFNLLEKGVAGFVTKFLAGGLNIAGMVFKTVGELAEGMLRGVVNFFTGGGGTKALAEGGEAAGKKFLPSLLTKIGGALVAGARFMPVIGGLISLWFAYDRFMSGDFRGALIDVVGAIGSFIIPVSGPIGAAISWGALALNAFLDLTKSEERIAEEKQGAEWVKNLPKTIGKYLMNLPFVKSIKNLGKGLWDYSSGMISNDASKVIEGLKTLNDSPLSFISSILLPIFENSVSTENKTGTKKIDYGKFLLNTTKTFIKKLFPNWLYNLVAKTMGWDDSKEDNFDVQKNESEYFDESKSRREKLPRLTELNQETTKTRKEIDDLTREMSDYTFSKDVTLEKQKQLVDLHDRLERLEESQKRIYESDSPTDNDNNWPRTNQYRDSKKSNPIPLDDGEISYNPELKIGNSTIAKFNPQDNFSITAAKPDGMFSEMNKMLSNQLENLNKQFSEIGKSLNSTSNISNNSYVNVNSLNGGGGSGFNDPILRSRSLYLQQVRFS